MSIDLAKENPYVAVASKKHRNLKKKMEKIVKFEQQLASGKALDQEQLILVQSKKSVEKALLDVAALKAQLEEVAKAQLEEQQGKTPTQETPNDGNGEEDYIADQANGKSVDEAGNFETANVETNTDAMVQYAASTMTELAAETTHTTEVERRVELEEKVTKLIKALHVYQRYKEVTAHALPDTVDFFGRTLLGLTTISGFQDTLQHSTRVAGYYLNEDLATQNEVVRGCNYVQMEHLIDTLAEEMERIPPNRTGSGNLTALLRNTISSSPAAHPSEPTINARPVPHTPHGTDVPAVGLVEISPNKFDLPAPPQAVPQFVTIEPNFGTLQFGMVASTPSPPPVAPAPAASSLSYATINFQPEPFFQLTPPAVSHTIPTAPQTVVVPPPPAVAVIPTPSTTTTSASTAVAMESLIAAAETTTATEDALAAVSESTDNTLETETNNKVEETSNVLKSGEAEEGNARNRRNRTRSNRRNNSPRGGGEAVEGGEEKGRRERKERSEPRFSRSTAKKDLATEEETAVKDTTTANTTANHNNKGLPKRRSFNREEKEGGKEYNWTKKASKASNQNNKTAESSEKTVEAAAAAAAATTATTSNTAEKKTPAAPVTETAAPATTAAPEPKGDVPPVKRSSYLDAVRPGAAPAPSSSSEAAKPSESSEDRKPARKPYYNKGGSGEEGRPPRRDRSNNRLPRDRKEGETTTAGAGESHGNSKPGPSRFENRKPVYRTNNNNNNTNNNSNNSNSNHNNTNNNRTVNSSQATARRPTAPAANNKTETA